MKSSKQPRSTKHSSQKELKPTPKRKLGPKPKPTLRANPVRKPKPTPKPKPRLDSKPQKARASTSSDILGGLSPKSQQRPISPKWKPHHRHLIDLRDQLIAQAGKLSQEASESTPSFSMHMADAGTDSFDRDFALSMLSSDQDALYEIEQAIKRIEDGNYGICEVTGRPIPQDRLEAIPWARFSAEAQRELE